MTKTKVICLSFVHRWIEFRIDRQSIQQSLSFTPQGKRKIAERLHKRPASMINWTIGTLMLSLYHDTGRGVFEEPDAEIHSCLNIWAFPV